MKKTKVSQPEVAEKLTSHDLSIPKEKGKQCYQSLCLNTSGLISPEWIQYYERLGVQSDDDDFISEEYQPISIDELERKTFGQVSRTLNNSVIQQKQSVKALKDKRKNKTDVLGSNKQKKEDSFDGRCKKERKSKKMKSKAGKDGVCKSVTEKAMDDSSLDLKRNGSESHSEERKQSSSSFSSHSFSSESSSSNKENMDHSESREGHIPSRLSPYAAEFIPRALALTQSTPFSHDYPILAQVQNTESQQQLAHSPLTLDGKIKNRRQEKERKNPYFDETNDLDQVKDHLSFNIQTPPVDDFFTLPVGHNAFSYNPRTLDLADPLDWNVIYSIFQTPSHLSKTNPRRLPSLERITQFSGSKTQTQLTASSPLCFNNWNENVPVSHYINSSPFSLMAAAGTGSSSSLSSTVSSFSFGEAGTVY